MEDVEVADLGSPMVGRRRLTYTQAHDGCISARPSESSAWPAAAPYLAACQATGLTLRPYLTLALRCPRPSLSHPEPGCQVGGRRRSLTLRCLANLPQVCRKCCGTAVASSSHRAVSLAALQK